MRIILIALTVLLLALPGTAQKNSPPAVKPQTTVVTKGDTTIIETIYPEKIYTVIITRFDTTYIDKNRGTGSSDTVLAKTQSKNIHADSLTVKNYPLVVTLLDSAAKTQMDKWITDLKTDPLFKNLTWETVRWGADGQTDYIFQFVELSPIGKQGFLYRINKNFGSNAHIQIKEQAPAHKVRQ